MSRPSRPSHRAASAAGSARHGQPLLARRAVLLGPLALAACQTGLGGGAPLAPGASVRVGMLLPFGSDTPSNDLVATSLQNAAQLAAGDLQGARVELAVHNTAADRTTAAAAAREAVSQGARVLLGPLYADETAAVGPAVPGTPVFSFSNNPDVAGGNVFILGHTFANAARRLLSFGATRGYDSVLVVHARNLAGEAGRKAVEQAAAETGVRYAGAASYEFSQRGVIDAIPAIAQAIREGEAKMVIFAADTAGALPILTQLLPENGIDPKEVKFAGLTRWDIPRSTLALPGVQGGWFTLPDPALDGAFRDRYTQAFGQRPHPLAGLAYDGVAAVGALAAAGGVAPFSRERITQPAGFAGVQGVFRFRADGTNERALALAEIVDKQVSIIDPAPRSFADVGA